MKLRISHVIIQPVLVWDDGEELTPGPALESFQVPLSKVGQMQETLPNEIAMLQLQLLAQQAEQESEPVADQDA